MSNIFEFKSSDRPVCGQQYLNLKVVRANQMKFDEKSLRALGPQLWNRLPPHIKNAGNLSAFKRLIKTWDGLLCKCNLCRKIWIHVQHLMQQKYRFTCVEVHICTLQFYQSVLISWTILYSEQLREILNANMYIPTLNKHIKSSQIKRLRCFCAIHFVCL